MKTIQILATIGFILTLALYFQNKKNRERLTNKAVAIKSILTEDDPAEMPEQSYQKQIEPISAKTLPEGEFVTVKRIKQITPDGIKAIPEGTKVKKIGEKDGKLIVSDSRITVEALASELTNDLAKASSFLGNALAYTPAPAPETPPSAPPPALESIKKPDYSYQINQLTTQIKELQDKINDLKLRKTKGINANGALIAKLELDLRELEAQKSRLISR